MNILGRLRVYARRYPFVVLTGVLAWFAGARPAHGECVRIPLEQVVNRGSIALVFSGTVASMTPIGEGENAKGFRVVIDVSRRWKGTVGRRVELYRDLITAVLGPGKPPIDSAK